MRTPLRHADIVGRIGNCVQNLRDPLDHIVTELANKHTAGALRFPNRAEFPIFLKTDDYVRFRGLDEVAPEVRLAIELLQPYHRTNGASTHPLWVLHQLTNIKKHRHPLASGAVGILSSIEIVEMRGIDLTGDIGIMSGPFEDNGVIARFRIHRVWPDAAFKINPKITADVAFSQSGPVGRASVVTILEELRDHVRNVIRNLESFL